MFCVYLYYVLYQVYTIDEYHLFCIYTLKIDEKVKELDTVIAELEKKRDEESGSVMKKLEATLTENKKLEALAQSAVDDKKDGLKAENKRKKELTKNSNDVRKLSFLSITSNFPLKSGLHTNNGL